MMKLNEIFNTRPDVVWKSTNTGFKGKFILEDEEYEILLDELEIELDKTFSILDIGFTKNGNYDLTNSKVSSTKVFGAVLNGMIPKIKEIKTDSILFGMNNKNGHVEDRKRLYEKIAKMYSRGSSYTNMSDWVKSKNGEYMILTKQSLTSDQKDKIDEFVASIPEKG
jgi:hypothetical protein